MVNFANIFNEIDSDSRLEIDYAVNHSLTRKFAGNQPVRY